MDFILSCIKVKFVTDLLCNLIKVSEAFSTQFSQLFITKQEKRGVANGNDVGQNNGLINFECI